MYGIQFAKASGLTVVATSSPHNFDTLKALGADAVFDYHSSSCAADIKSFTQNKLRYSWDCIGNGAETCAAAMSDTERSFYGTINPPNAKSTEAMKEINPKIDGPRFTLGYDAVGESYDFVGKVIPPKLAEMEYARAFIDLSRKLLATGVVKPVHVSVNQTGSGLEGALKGLDELKSGRVSGAKLVYTL